MPSNALAVHLKQLLADAVELDDAHTQLRTGNAGRQYGLAALNRSVVVTSVSAWESYVEELTRESARVLRPAGPPLGMWEVLDAHVAALLGRFNTPNPENVRRLLRDGLGLPDVRAFWNWQNTTAEQAGRRLKEAMDYRHQIAHGVAAPWPP